MSAWTIEAKAEFQTNVVFQSYSWHSAAKFSDEYLAEVDNYNEQYGDLLGNINIDREYNETNEALGIELIGKRHGFVAGVYRDSFNTWAKYAAGIYLHTRRKHVDLGFLYGMIQSPSYFGGDPLFMVLPYLSIHAGPIGINFMYIPKTSRDTAHVIAAQLKVMF